jgi:hypothetical protein
MMHSRRAAPQRSACSGGAAVAIRRARRSLAARAADRPETGATSRTIRVHGDAFVDECHWASPGSNAALQQFVAAENKRYRAATRPSKRRRGEIEYAINQWDWAAAWEDEGAWEDGASPGGAAAGALHVGSEQVTARTRSFVYFRAAPRGAFHAVHYRAPWAAAAVVAPPPAPAGKRPCRLWRACCAAPERQPRLQPRCQAPCGRLRARALPLRCRRRAGG